jgi:hypothetical protein
VVRTLTTVEGDGGKEVEPLEGPVTTVKVEQGTVSIVVAIKVEPCAFVVVYRLVVVV